MYTLRIVKRLAAIVFSLGLVFVIGSCSSDKVDGTDDPIGHADAQLDPKLVVEGRLEAQVQLWLQAGVVDRSLAVCYAKVFDAAGFGEVKAVNDLTAAQAKLTPDQVKEFEDCGKAFLSTTTVAPEPGDSLAENTSTTG